LLSLSTSGPGSAANFGLPSSPVGLPHVTEDRLKALGGATATIGAVGLFHVIGTTPEVPDAAAAFAGAPPHETIMLTPAMIDETRRCLSTVTLKVGDALDPVAVGSPHLSAAELRALRTRLAGRPALRHPALCLQRASRLAGDRREPGAGGAPAAQAASASHLGPVRTPIAAGLDRRPVHVMFRSQRWPR